MGRPKSTERKISVSITVGDDVKDYARHIGKGNMSRGFEILARAAMEKEGFVPEAKDEPSLYRISPYEYEIERFER